MLKFLACPSVAQHPEQHLHFEEAFDVARILRMPQQRHQVQDAGTAVLFVLAQRKRGRGEFPSARHPWRMTSLSARLYTGANLHRIGQLKAEPRNPAEVLRLLAMASARLADAQLAGLLPRDAS